MAGGCQSLLSGNLRNNQKDLKENCNGERTHQTTLHGCGNEPAGRVDFQSKGYLKPKVSFTVVVPKEAAPAGKVTLLARQHCNLHGLWEGGLDVTVV